MLPRQQPGFVVCVEVASPEVALRVNTSPQYESDGIEAPTDLIADLETALETTRTVGVSIARPTTESD